MPYILLLILFVLGMGVGGYNEEKNIDYTFVDYEIEDESEYPEWVDCEDESDNLYI